MKKIVAHPMFIPGLILAVLVIAFAAFPGLREGAFSLWGKASGTEYNPPKVSSQEGPAELVFDAKGQPVGLRLTTEESLKGVNPEPKVALDPKLGQPRALPVQFGTINYDYERMFQIRSRFPGEVAEFTGEGFIPRHDLDSGSPSPTKYRPLRVGDKVEQDELLAVVWSQTLGQAKSALMDAICSLALSEKQYELRAGAFKEAAISLAQMMQTERQVQADTLNKLSALRSLMIWKLTQEDIEQIEGEAKKLRKLIIDKKLPSPNNKADMAEWDRVTRALAQKWARVEIRAPIFKRDDDGKIDRDFSLIIVEKNTNLSDMLDPTATSYPMFKLADLSRLQVMVQPHEEYYPLLREQLNKGKLNWQIEVDAYPHAKPLKPRIVQVLPAVDPSLRTCLVTGFLESPDLTSGRQDGWFGKYLVGQFVRATMFVEPEEGTVEIPTNALNDAEGESLVFVQDPRDKQTFRMRRVSVVQRFKDVTYVRTVLTERDKQISGAEVAINKRPIEVLKPGEIVVTRSIVELKAAFDTLSARHRNESVQAEAGKGKEQEK